MSETSLNLFFYNLSFISSLFLKLGINKQNGKFSLILGKVV